MLNYFFSPERPVRQMFVVVGSSGLVADIQVHVEVVKIIIQNMLYRTLLFVLKMSCTNFVITTCQLIYSIRILR